MSMMLLGVGNSGAASETTEGFPMDELLFQQEGKAPLFVTDINDEVKRFFARHPERLYDLTPRKFEILIADILKDLGFETHLTQTTRDGGRDIYAFLRNAATSFLMFVECKKWKDNVGIEIVQRLHGTCTINNADKGMIVTTSFFTEPAKDEHKRIATKMELVDFEKFKDWLARYK
ncbi:MAG: restriction endonuclease [Verrucomicrobiaceae bacterium]